MTKANAHTQLSALIDIFAARENDPDAGQYLYSDIACLKEVAAGLADRVAIAHVAPTLEALGLTELAPGDILSFTMQLYVNVSNLQALITAATARAMVDGIEPADWLERLQDHAEDGRQGCASHCLRILLDPGVSPDGCEIVDSVCE